MPAKPREVVIVETGMHFASARLAALYIRGEYGAVYAVLRGERKTHKGYSFVYAD